MNESKAKSKKLPAVVSVIAIAAAVMYVFSLVAITATFGVLWLIGYVVATIALIIATCISLYVVCMVLVYFCHIFDKEEPVWVNKTLRMWS